MSLRKCIGCIKMKYIEDKYFSNWGYSCENCTPNYYICSKCKKCIKQLPIDDYEPFKIIDNMGMYICKNC